MPGLDLSGFNVPEQSFGGLYKAADTVERANKEQRQQDRENAGRQASTSKFLTDYLDPKDHLTGTNYDPQIVSGFQDVLQQAQQLASKGASTTDILMAIGPSVNKLNQYSTTAKTIDQTIKGQVQKLKGYAGYNPEALLTEAKKQAFYGPDGKLKDISTVDPNEDYVSMAAKNNPEAITSGKGLDDFVAKTPMNENSFSGTTAYGGRSRQTSFDAKFHDWMAPAKDEKGNIATDENGMALPMRIKGTPMLDDKNNPILNPETGKPFIAMDKGYFQAVMQHNPDVADFIRGQVNKHFKDAGAKEVPVENSPQWDMMARHILGDELQLRDHSTLKTRDVQKESAPAIKVELGQNPSSLDALANYEQAIKLKGDYSVYDPKSGKATKTNPVQTIGEIFNNNPAFVQGKTVDLPDGRSVVDVTESFPGGGLKTGRGSNETIQSVFYDPQKREMIVRHASKKKDANGHPLETEDEVIPEAKAGQYMARIAGQNGVDPNKVGDILTQAGYHGAKFTKPANADQIGGRMGEDHAAKIESAVKSIESDSFDNLKDLQTKDGIIQKVNNRNLAGWLPWNGRYEVDVKTPDGKTKTIPFKTKEELTNYIKGSPVAGGSKKGVLD